MSDLIQDARLVNRRGFLKGSALFAAAAVAGLAAAVPAAAQDQAPAPAEQKPEQPQEPKTGEQPKKKVLVDEKGREYRVCDMCGGSMYKDGKTWTCEQCGYSYEE